LWITVLLVMGVLGAAASQARADVNVREWPALEQGDRDQKTSGAVHAVQYLLKQRGFKVEVNGDYNKQTAKQVLAFQKSKGLTETGAMSRQTWEALIMTVRNGSTGAAVRGVQILLKRSGADVEVDGDFGSQTESAVRNFQTQQGIVSDGIVGPNTWNQLVVGGKE
jgi:peptidoglycan hydrolase-like protein with peptidoglycan-binding domain